MSTLRQQIIDVLESTKAAFWPDELLGRVTATKHASRIRNVLMDLERDGLVVLTANGWKRTNTEAQVTPEPTQHHRLLDDQKPMNEVADMSTIKEQVTAVLERNPGLTSKEISEWLPNMNRQNIYAIVSAMAKEGTLSRTLTEPYKYSLKSAEQEPDPKTEAQAPVAEQAEPEAKSNTDDPAPIPLKNLSDHPVMGRIGAEPSAPEPSASDIAVAVVSTEKTVRAIRILQSSANQAREALETYLDSIDDPVLTHLMNAVNEADQAVDAYAARNPQ